MSAPTTWNDLLQAFHSALIDELTARKPEPKPSLGLPRKLEGFGEPAASNERTLFASIVHLDGKSSGLVSLAFEPSALSCVQASAEEVWACWLKRVIEHEFKIRKISARIEAPVELPPKKMPLLAPARFVWIPMSVEGGNCFLGMGV